MRRKEPAPGLVTVKELVTEQLRLKLGSTESERKKGGYTMRCGKVNRFIKAGLTLALVLLTLLAPAGAVRAALIQPMDADAAGIAQETKVYVRKGPKYYYLYYKSPKKKVTGYKGIAKPKKAKNAYFFISKKGIIYVDTWIRRGTRYYYADEQGRLLRGSVRINNRYYYFDPKTYERYSGWKTGPKNTYYYGPDGARMYGFQKIGDYTYYLNPNHYGVRVTGWMNISGDWYYFDKNGRMRTGLIRVGGKVYYINDEGKRQTGFITRNNKTYYFDPETGVMSTGTRVIDGVSYNFGTNGYLAYNPNDPWRIQVNQTTCVVTVYRGSVPVRAMLCSVGLNGATPTGTFSLGAKKHWQPLFGNVYGQYSAVITGDILFHSVYYYTYRDIHSLATAEYNKLGTPASAGCVRLNCADAYYIYNNCPVGTQVRIFYGTAADDPMGRPAKLVINTDYDPTDPYPND